MAIMGNKRLLLELDKHRRDVNQKIINASMEALNLDKLVPIVDMVAKSRAAYISALMDMSENQSESGPSREQIEQLKARRLEFKELVQAANALEVAIERGYLDVEGVESD